MNLSNMKSQIASNIGVYDSSSQQNVGTYSQQNVGTQKFGVTAAIVGSIVASLVGSAVGYFSSRHNTAAAVS